VRPEMVVSGRWTRVRTLGRSASEAGVFRAHYQAFGHRGGGGSGGRAAVVSLSTGERWSGSSASQSAGLLPAAAEKASELGQRCGRGACSGRCEMGKECHSIFFPFY
jgi:hypothetical protein